jgi:hypothetical protein
VSCLPESVTSSKKKLLQTNVYAASLLKEDVNVSTGAKTSARKGNNRDTSTPQHMAGQPPLSDGYAAQASTSPPLGQLALSVATDRNPSSSEFADWMPNRKASGQWLGGPPGAGKITKRVSKRRVKGPKDVKALLASKGPKTAPKKAFPGQRHPFVFTKETPRNQSGQ